MTPRRVAGVALAVGLGLAALALSSLAGWLVTEDPLARADALVVLNGDNVRALEGAALYHAGWAPRVWLTQVPDHPGLTPAAATGALVDAGTRTNLALLQTAGVPAAAIRILPGAVAGTADEIRLVARALGGQGRVILVTSPAHTRRVGTLWRRLVGDRPEAVVRYARQEPWDPARWWWRPRERALVLHEALGLVQAWLRPGARPL